MKPELQKRVEAFLWATGTMVLAMAVDFLATNVGLFNMPAEVTVVLGLVFNQISKAIHNKMADTGVQ